MSSASLTSSRKKSSKRPDQGENFDENNLQGREDLTGVLMVTIAPIDARDFDDAISLDRSADGHWHLGVHIADVAHFVQPGTPLDREAQTRGTSVYLPTKVIPMLPEVLSNALASLQEKRVRFTKSCFISTRPTAPCSHPLAKPPSGQQAVIRASSHHQQRGTQGVQIPAKVRKLLAGCTNWR